MMKTCWRGAVAAVALLASRPPAQADKKYTFALVPKNTNNPFFDQALRRLQEGREGTNGAIECLYIGPGEHGGGDEQAQIVADLITKGSTASPSRRRTRRRWPMRCRAPRREHPGADLGLRPAAAGQGAARRLCRHAQL